MNRPTEPKAIRAAVADTDPAYMDRLYSHPGYWIEDPENPGVFGYMKQDGPPNRALAIAWTDQAEPEIEFGDEV